MEEYVDTHTPSLAARPKFRQILVELAQQLVDGYALDTEGLIDVLTLKASLTRSSKDSVIALEKLYRDTVRFTPPKPQVLQLILRPFRPAGDRLLCCRSGDECTSVTSELHCLFTCNDG